MIGRRAFLAGVALAAAGIRPAQGAPVKRTAAAAKITNVLTIDPEGTGNFQGVFPGDAGAWYVTRDDDGDAVIDRHDAKGKYLDSCVLEGAGHVTATGIRGGLVLTTRAGQLVTFPYRAGVIRDSEVRTVLTEAGVELQVSLSPTGTRALVRRRPGDGQSYFTRYVTDELLAAPSSGVPARALELGVIAGGQGADPLRVEQSFGVVNTSAFLAYGSVGKRNWLEQWSLLTGQKIGPDLDLTSYGASVAPGFHEVEYAPGRYVCAKVGTGSSRRLVIGSHDLPSEV